MEDYLFVLGRDKELSLLELICYFNRKNIKYKFIDKWNNFALFSLNDNKFDINELGGTIKIAEIIFKGSNKNELVPFLEKLEIPNKNKIYYSVNSDYIKSILSRIFKEQHIKAYYKSNASDPSSSTRLDIELITFKDYIFKVIQVSNPKSYKKRDEIRPRFDEKKGISIRLAKMLVNLSESKKEIFDPFCGTGTILQEALLMNLDAYGLDIDISEAKENLKWLNQNFSIKNNFKLFQGDAKYLSKFVKYVEVVVTEPYLGPYLKKNLRYEEIKKLIFNLQYLYKEVFSELNKITKRIVIIFPVFLTRDKNRFSLDISLILDKTDFKIAKYFVKLPIKYKYKNSILEREIWIFEK
jgi:tRNA G10  N-methylase Trm11